jgi:hypothetical protein
MGKQKTARPTSPQVVATLSSLLLLLVSCALGFYFMELRGPGVRTLLSGSQASEVLVLLGGLAAVVLTGHLAVANAARSAQGVNGYRKLIRRAAEVDSSDPDVLQPFVAVPELRDLVGVLVAEKEQGRQLQDALESVRGEYQGLLAGMQRSLEDGSRMREDHPSELGRKVATLWNSLIERVEAGVTQPSGSSDEPSAAASGAGQDVTEKRLHELEERVTHLQSMLGGDRDGFLVTDDESMGTESMLIPESQPEIIDLEDELDPISPLLLQEEQEAAESLVTEPHVASATQAAIPTVAAESPAPESPGADPAHAPRGVDEVAEEQDVDLVEEGVESTFAPPKEDEATMSAVPWREQGEAPAATSTEVEDGTPQQEEVRQTDDAESGERTYSEWGGASFAALTAGKAAGDVGFGTAPDKPVVPATTNDGDVGFGAAVAHGSSQSSDAVRNVPTTASGGPARDNSRMRFPEFAAPRGKDQADRVEVTYDGSTAMEADEEFLSFDAPVQEALVEEAPLADEDDAVVDLKSLGALETNE